VKKRLGIWIKDHLGNLFDEGKKVETELTEHQLKEDRGGLLNS